MAFAVSRQAGGAVHRNRARRRMREAYRRQPRRVPEGIALVFVARPRALVAGFQEIVGEMRSVLATLWRPAGAGVGPERSVR